MNGLEIRQALRAGRRVYASAMVSPSSLWPRMMQQAGVDFVFIDSEHTPLDRSQLSWACQAFQAFGVPPVVRIPSPDPFAACQVLDGGAAGVIVPYVETVEQVKTLTGATRWRPLKGNRLSRVLDDDACLEPQLKQYLQERNQHTIYIANIESVPAIERLDDLLAIGSIDAVLIGPHDLSCSLGVPEQYDHPKFITAAKTIFEKARAAGCGAGLHWWEGVHQEQAWIDAGANLIMHSTDITLVAQNLKRELGKLRERNGDAPASDVSGTSSDTV